MLEFVNKLLDSKDNIIDQLLILKENKNNKEVKKYINALVRENNSPYFKYCIDKYYFDKNVKEVKPEVPILRPLYYLMTDKKIEKILNRKDNLIDQILLLKKYKKDKDVDNYVSEYLECWSSQYEAYCIKKYYYDMDVEEVKPTVKSLNIRLYKISFKSLEDKQEKLKIKEYKKAIKNIREGDKVKLLDGPFENLIGIVKSFDIDNFKIFVTIELFEEKYDIEHNGKFEIIKEDNNAKKN